MLFGKTNTKIEKIKKNFPPILDSQINWPILQVNTDVNETRKHLLLFAKIGEKIDQTRY